MLLNLLYFLWNYFIFNFKMSNILIISVIIICFLILLLLNIFLMYIPLNRIEDALIDIDNKAEAVEVLVRPIIERVEPLLV